MFITCLEDINIWGKNSWMKSNWKQEKRNLSCFHVFYKGNKALKSEILSRSSPHFLISRHDLKILNQNWGSMFGDSKQINWEAGNSNLLFLSNFLEMTCSKFPILRLYYLYTLCFCYSIFIFSFLQNYMKSNTISKSKLCSYCQKNLVLTSSKDLEPII